MPILRRNLMRFTISHFFGLNLIIIALILVVHGCKKEDVQPPEVIVLRPSDASEIRIDSTFIVIVDASDNVDVEKVELLLDGKQFRSAFYKPYEFKIIKSTLGIGLHTLFAKAYDLEGNIGSSKIINIRIIDKTKNIFIGTVTNFKGEGIKGATIKIAYLNQKYWQDRNDTTKSLLVNQLKDLYHETISKRNLYFSNNETIDKMSTEVDSVFTDVNGHFVINDLAEGNYELEILASGYDKAVEQITQKEGTVEYNFKLKTTENLQVTGTRITDLKHRIRVDWNSINLPTIIGYDIFERHYFSYSLEGSTNEIGFSPIYTNWRKVNNSLIIETTFEFDSQEYNGKYEVCVIPVNIEGKESPISEKTKYAYLLLEENKMYLGSFGLTSLSSQVKIPNNTHEFALHMSFYYNISPLLFEWRVYISENKSDWVEIGRLSIDKGQPSGLIKTTDYGYYQSFSLNNYKGKTIYFKTFPVSDNIDMKLGNYIGDYSQDGSIFSSLTNIPVVDFTATRTNPEINEIILFTDQSTNNPISWNWDFGDGEKSTIENPSHSYKAAGTYSISLTVSNSYGSNTETKVDYITVNETGSNGEDIVFNPSRTYGTVSDIDGNTYKTIQIGSQTWMAENLKTRKYNDGTNIPLVTDNTSSSYLTTPGYCWYNNNETTYKSSYGALYNYYTVNTGKLCPSDWHVPSDAEWTTLTNYLGGIGVAGGKLKETGTTHWLGPNTRATNETGFTALPGGGRYDYGTFDGIGVLSDWWSSSEDSSSDAWSRGMSYNYGDVYRGNFSKQFGFSVRCVRD